MRKRNLILVTLLCVAAFAKVEQSIAHTGVSGIVKERMDAMKTLGDHAKSVGDMLKGKTRFDLNVAAEASSAFISHGEHMTMLFPDTEESRHGAKTEALPAIWANWDDFKNLIEQFTQDSRTLATMVEKLDTETLSEDEQSRAVRRAFFKASKNCSACHERFRLEQK